jgi:hypothetical protein
MVVLVIGGAPVEAVGVVGGNTLRAARPGVPGGGCGGDELNPERRIPANDFLLHIAGLSRNVETQGLPWLTGRVHGKLLVSQVPQLPKGVVDDLPIQVSRDQPWNGLRLRLVGGSKGKAV